MRTPIHVRTTARESAPCVSEVGSEYVIGHLITTAGPKDETGRLVRVFLTARQAQELAASLSELLGTEEPATHRHEYGGQTLVHSHTGGAKDHGYFEHPEDLRR